MIWAEWGEKLESVPKISVTIPEKMNQEKMEKGAQESDT